MITQQVNHLPADRWQQRNSGCTAHPRPIVPQNSISSELFRATGLAPVRNPAEEDNQKTVPQIYSRISSSSSLTFLSQFSLSSLATSSVIRVSLYLVRAKSEQISISISEISPPDLSDPSWLSQGCQRVSSVPLRCLDDRRILKSRVFPPLCYHHPQIPVPRMAALCTESSLSSD